MITPTLCSCGCLQPILPGDILRGTILPNHERLGGSPSYLVMDMGYKTPCWVWQGCLNKWGYAKLKRGGITQGGHRLFYRAYVNPDLPQSRAGKDGLDHLCRTRKCVRPDHLEPATCTENIRRGRVARIGELAGSNVGQHLEEIGRRYAAGESQYQIAVSLGVRQPCISRILRGTRWKGLVVPIPTRSVIKLTPDQVEQIRLLCSSGVTQRSVAAQFGMGQSQVSRIVRGESWAATT